MVLLLGNYLLHIVKRDNVTLGKEGSLFISQADLHGV